MSSSLFDLGMRLAARDRGQALPRLARAHVALRSDARVISLMAMSGDHVGIWGIAMGPPDLVRPKTLVAGDPRRREEQVRLWQFIAEQLHHYIRWCEAEKRCPQLLVATPQCWEQLVASAKRFAWSGDPALAEAAASVVVLDDRYGTAGQQAVISATSLLAEHAVRGCDPHEERTLSGLLTWHPMVHVELDNDDDDCTIPPRLDHEVSPIAQRLRRLERQSGDRSTQVLRASLAAVIEPVLLARWARLKAAAVAFHALGLSPLPECRALSQNDEREWARWASRRAQGKHPLRPSRRSAIVAMVAREAASEQFASAVLTRDDLAFRRAAHDGTVFAGVLQTWDGRTARVTMRGAPRLRAGAAVVWRADPQWAFVVTALETAADGIEAVLTSSRRGEHGDLPASGSTIQLLPHTPDTRPVAAALRRISGDRLPWTHRLDPRELPATAPAWLQADAVVAPRCDALTRPADVLADVRRLREGGQRHA